MPQVIKIHLQPPKPPQPASSCVSQPCRRQGKALRAPVSYPRPPGTGAQMMLAVSRGDAPASGPSSCDCIPEGQRCMCTGLPAFYRIGELYSTPSAAVGSCGMREESNKSCFGTRDEWRGGGSGKMRAGLPSGMQLGGLESTWKTVLCGSSSFSTCASVL